MRVMAQIQVAFEGQLDGPTNTINISQSGLLAPAPPSAKVADILHLTLFLPPQKDSVLATGRVARILERDGQALAGIQFLEMTDAHKDRWLSYMAMIESLSSERGEVTTSSVLLEERRKEGRNRQSFLLRFEDVQRLETFLKQSVLAGSYAFSYPMAKSPGDLVSLALLHPATDRTLEIEAQIATPVAPEDYDKLCLVFANFNSDQRLLLERFLRGESTAPLDAPEESTSEREETVLMEPIADTELAAQLEIAKK